jgi:hypothetical protein
VATGLVQPAPQVPQVSHRCGRQIELAGLHAAVPAFEQGDPPPHWIVTTMAGAPRRSLWLGCAGPWPVRSPYPHGELPMNLRVLPLAIVAIALSSAVVLSHAAGNATPAEATALVKKGLAFVKAQGKDKAYVEISNKQGQFVDRDLYLVVYGLDGVVRAHGANEKMIGKNLIDLKDVDGKAFVKERVELAQSKGTFWQDYKFTNPVTKKIEPKAMYCERIDDAVLCGGVYK